MCCDTPCKSKDESIGAVHSGCASLQSVDIPLGFLTATRLAFPPSFRDGRQRCERVKRLVVARLKESYSFREVLVRAPLRNELWSMIASYLIREFVIFACQQHATVKAPEPDLNHSTIKLSGYVFASFITIDGVNYVKNLRSSSTECDMREAEVLLLDTQRRRTIRDIYVVEDPLGIRDVSFVSNTDRLYHPYPFSNLWWRVISVAYEAATITCTSDGMKLRAIQIYEPDIALAAPLCDWPLRNLKATLIDLEEPSISTVWPSQIRMSSIRCNAPRISGYSALVFGNGLVKIHAHEKSDDKARRDDAYKEGCSHLRVFHSIYMPVDEDEYITEIWGRSSTRLHPGDHGALIVRSSCDNHFDSKQLNLAQFVTSKGRITLFGSSMASAESKYYRIHTPPRSESRIYFNTLDLHHGYPRIRYCAFEDVKLTVSKAYPNWLTDNHPLLDRGLWFQSSCRLEGVSELTLCRKTSLKHRPITGMLVTNGNGFRSCLGQYRFDWALEHISYLEYSQIYFEAARMKRLSFLYITDVWGTPPTQSNKDSLLAIPLKGTLVVLASAHCFTPQQHADTLDPKKKLKAYSVFLLEIITPNHDTSCVSHEMQGESGDEKASGFSE